LFFRSDREREREKERAWSQVGEVMDKIWKELGIHPLLTSLQHILRGETLGKAGAWYP